MSQKSLGVIVGRFHVDDLHEGHTDLISDVSNIFDQVLIVVGLGPCKCTVNNPLDFHTRRFMLQARFPNVKIAYIADVKEDRDWSLALDDLVTKYSKGFDSITLCGGRDSFIKHYTTKKYPTKELIQRAVVSGTEIRKRIAVQAQESAEFRAGAIWYSLNQYPQAIPTVDIAVINRQEELILLGRKPKEEAFRLIGGFAQPGETYEFSAARELQEEANLIVPAVNSKNALHYERSFVVDDWRYRNEVNKITTLLFTVFDWSGTPAPGDDICELRWMPLSTVTLQKLVDEHVDMFLYLVKQY